MGSGALEHFSSRGLGMEHLQRGVLRQWPTPDKHRVTQKAGEKELASLDSLLGGSRSPQNKIHVLCISRKLYVFLKTLQSACRRLRFMLVTQGHPVAICLDSP